MLRIVGRMLFVVTAAGLLGAGQDKETKKEEGVKGTVVRIDMSRNSITIKTDSGEFSDEAASALDFDRFFQAFPTLKEHALTAIPPETKIPPGGQAQGTVVVRFPVTQDGFDKRKSLSVVIQPYDQPLPVVLTR